MKRVLILIVFSAFLIGSASAQFAFGVKGGLTVSDNNIDVIPDTVHESIFGYNAGVFFKIGEGLFSFQPEIMFVRKGTKINDKSSDYYQQYNMNYIDVPLLLRIGVNLKIAELYFNMGPYAGYNFSTKVKNQTYDEAQGIWVKNEYDYEFNEHFIEKWDAGVVMGVGARLLMLMFEVRYNQGVLHLGHPYYDSSNNKYVSVSLGVQF